VKIPGSPLAGGGTGGGLQIPGASWNATALTCAGTYCHGGAEPAWTRLDQGEAACGTCHGVPPATPAHAPTLTLRDCHTCHAGSVDAFGNILTNGRHLDGNVDL
jgi:predicted CxxxxCH...CXXCH cytochrome family protein